MHKLPGNDDYTLHTPYFAEIFEYGPEENDLETIRYFENMDQAINFLAYFTAGFCTTPFMFAGIEEFREEYVKTENGYIVKRSFYDNDVNCF